MKRPAPGWIYLSSFIALGIALSLLGPSLTYLRERAHVSTGEIGVLFVAQSLGYLIGSLLIGRLYDRGFGHRALAGGLVGLAASAVFIPLTPSVGMLVIPVAFIGVFASVIDVGGNTLVVWHSRRSGSVRLLNALHLFFGIGALLCPVLVDRSLAWSHGLSFAAGVIAVYSLVIAVVVVLHDAPTDTSRGLAGATNFGDEQAGVQTPVRILLVICVFFVLYVGVEIGFSGWIKTYAEGIHLPGSGSPTFLNTAFWVSFTLGRLFAVLLGKRVRSGQMLAVSCVLTVGLLIVMAVADGSPLFVWITTSLIGIAMAPQFATMIAYAEERITLSGRATSWFVSAAGLGSLILPFVIGQLLDRSSGLMPVAVGCAALLATGWLLVVRRSLNNHVGVPPELVHEPVRA